MSGGGGSSSDGGNEQAAAKAAMTTQAAYTSSASPATTAKVDTGGRDESTQQAALQTYHQNLEDYDTPDKDHWKDTQKQIKDHTKGDHYDVKKMSDEEYKQFNKELNEYYGTEGVKYEPYGRAGQGTVNLTFKEHWDNVGMQHPISRISPIGRFLVAAGRNINEYFRSDYGTYKYGGPGRDKGGLLGRIGTGDGGSWAATEQDRAVMNKLAPDAPYIVSGQEKPDSIAQQWFDNTNTNQNEFFFKNQYSTAKAKQLQVLGNPSPYRWLAVSQSPYYDFLKRNNLDRGIL